MPDEAVLLHQHYRGPSLGLRVAGGFAPAFVAGHIPAILAGVAKLDDSMAAK